MHARIDRNARRPWRGDVVRLLLGLLVVQGQVEEHRKGNRMHQRIAVVIGSALGPGCQAGTDQEGSAPASMRSGARKIRT